MLVVEANVYNLDFWYLREIKRENVIIRARPDFSDIRKKFCQSREHFPTGIVAVKVPENIEPEKAIEYAVQELWDYEILLSFAQDRHVFFHGFECFEVEGDSKKLLEKTWHSIRTGKPRGVGIIWQKGLEEFLKTGVPLLRDPDYNRKTRIKRALLLYNEASIMRTANVVEVEHPTLFVALEVLSNAHVKINPKTFLFSNTTWKELIQRVQDVLDELSVGPNSRSRILGSLGFAKQGSAKERIMYLLESLGLPTYEREITQMVDLRNDILHGRDLKENYDGESPIDVVIKCKRLLAKLILKLLRFYHREDVIHGAYLRSDLKARF